MFDLNFKKRPSVFSSGTTHISLFSKPVVTSRPTNLSLTPRSKVNQTDSPYLNIEREVVSQNGGTPTERNLGADGHSHFSGKPMEVKYATKGRFRVNRIDHMTMLSKGGMYILVNSAGQQMKMPAWQLDKYIRYKWLLDREKQAPGKYSHAFVYSKDLPGNFGMG
jgi:hypothetical protein